MKKEAYQSIVRHEDYLVRDHLLYGVRILPGASLIDLFYRVVLSQGVEANQFELRKVLFIEPISTSRQWDRRVRVSVLKSESVWNLTVESQKFSGEALADAQWHENARCEVHFTPLSTPRPAVLANLMEQAVRLNADVMYAAAREAQLVHLSFLKTEGTLFQGPDFALAELTLNPLAEQYISHFFLHPTFLDAAILTSFALGEDGKFLMVGSPYAPLYIESFRAYAPTPDHCCVLVRRQGSLKEFDDTFQTDIYMYDREGRPLASFQKCVTKRVRSEAAIAQLESQGSEPLSTEPGGDSLPPKTEPEGERGGAQPRPAPRLGDAVGSLADVAAERERINSYITEDLRKTLAGFLDIEPERVEVAAGFYAQGLDSTHLLHFVRELEKKLGEELYPTLLFEYSTIEALSRYFLERYGEKYPGLPEHYDTVIKGVPGDASSPGHLTEPDSPDSVPTYSFDWVGVESVGVLDGVRPETGPLLVFSRPEDIEMLRGELQRCNLQSSLAFVLPGAAFRQLSPERYEINPARERDFLKLLGALKDSALTPSVVLYAWNYRAEALSQPDAHAGAAALVGDELLTGVFGVFQLNKALLRTHPSARVRLFYLCPLNQPHERALASYFRAVHRESPSLSGRVIALEEPKAEALVSAMMTEYAEEDPRLIEVRYVAGRREVKRVRRLPARPAQQIEGRGIRRRGAYLITGGAGGLGLILARHLTKRFQARLALVGRSALKPQQEELLNQLRSNSEEVIYLQADVEQMESLERAVSLARLTLGKLDGVIHAAGILDDSLVINKELSSFERAIGAKVYGTLNLDYLTRNDSLDFFMMFSSVASVLGNWGQADYAYANGFMDNFAETRQAIAGPTVAINWPLWRDGGMKVSAETEAYLSEKLGIGVLTLEEGASIFEGALQAQATQVLVFQGDSRKLVDYGLEDPAPGVTLPAAAERTMTPPLGREEVTAYQDSSTVSDSGENRRPVVRTREAAAQASLERDDEGIAIIGLSGRYPLARDLEEFWNNLLAGRDCIELIPQSRWDATAYYDPDRARKGRSNSKWGGFIEGCDRFDPLFFNISPRDAKIMDPQERLFLRTAWETFEDAGYTREMLNRIKSSSRPKDVGVFVGVMWSDYQLFGGGGEIVPTSWFCSVANRVSYFFDFHGPSMALDTACSSSLLAIHLACESLRQGECLMALAGGVNLSLHPSKYLKLSQWQMLSSDGRCRSFGAGGDGYVPGEGVGAILLKNFRAAVADGDHIYAVIKSSAVNHGGRSSGYTVPNPASQSQVIGEALEKAGIDARTITYLEAHGTGTALGDPIEIEGLTRAFGKQTSDKQFCAIGSVKSNIGHLESAAGISAVTKVLLEMKHGVLVPSLHSEQPNPEINFSQSPFYLQREAASWNPSVTHGDGRVESIPRRAGISSFGAGGVNVHLVLEEPPDPHRTPAQSKKALGGPEVIVLSAKTEASLRGYAGSLRRFIGRRLELPAAARAIRLADVAYTLQVGREAMEWRLAFVAHSLSDLHEKLEKFIDGRTQDEALFYGRADAHALKNRQGRALRVWDDSAGFDEGSHRLRELAAEWAKGATIDWSWPDVATGDERRRRISLPTYYFTEDRYWVDARPASSQAHEPVVDSRAPVVASVESAQRGDTRSAKSLSLVYDHVKDHKVLGSAIVPAMMYVELALAAGHEIGGGHVNQAQRLLFLEPLVVGGQGAQAEIIFDEPETAERSLLFEIRTKSSDGKQKLHSSGLLRLAGGPGSNSAAPPLLDVAAIERRSPNELDREALERQFQRRGIQYGETYRALESVRYNEREGIGRLRLSGEVHGRLSPQLRRIILLDAALQSTIGLFANVAPSTRDLILPYSIESALLYDALDSAAYTYVEAIDVSERKGFARFNIAVTDETGRVLCALNDFCVKGVASEVSWALPQTQAIASPAGLAQSEMQFFRPQWRRVDFPPQADADGHGAVVILDHEADMGLGDKLAEFYRHSPVRRVRLGRQHRRLGPDMVEIDHLNLPDYVTALAGLQSDPTIYFLGGVYDSLVPDTALDVLNEIQEKGVLSLLRLIKGLNHHGYDQQKIVLKIITCDQHRIRETDPCAPLAAGLNGLARVIRHEYPQMSVSIVDISRAGLEEPDASNDISAANSRAGLPQHLHAESGASLGLDVAIRGDERYVKGIEAVSLPPAEAGALALRHDGVYVIVGGTGGIGYEIAASLARQVNCRLALVGRREADDHVKDRIERLRAIALDVVYLQGDVSQYESMRRVMALVRERYGVINGVVHSALVLRDASLENMTEENFRAALKPKTAGTVVLDLVTRDDELDFLVYLSSVNSMIGNAGQSNYVAGSTFQDAYALYLEQVRACRVKVLNWGYWGETGVVASAAYRERLSRQGIFSISTEEGIAAFNRVLGSSAPQVMALKAALPVLLKIGLDRRRKARILELPRRASVIRRLPSRAPAPVTNEEAIIRALDDKNRLDDWSRRSLLNLLYRLTGGPGAKGYVSLAQLKTSFGLLPKYERLFRALLLILQKCGWVEIRDDGFKFASHVEELMGHEWTTRLEAEKRRLLADAPEFAAHIRLLDVCFASYQAILTGQISATDVLFPDSSLEMVEGIYRGSSIVDYFNHLAAYTIRSIIELRRGELTTERPLRMVEIGAGTGGTTAFVLKAIAGLGEPVEYYYTDISPGFTRFAEKHFGPSYPFLRYGTLNIEKAVERQGFAAGTFDVVLAANVLHATSDIRDTLGRTKCLLRAGGITVLNEGTRAWDFLTMTFGLTDGWWLFRDAESRLEYSPLLSFKGWRDALYDCGFRRVRALGLPGEKDAELFQQSIILGESDGAIYSGEVDAVEPAHAYSPIIPERPQAETLMPGEAANSSVLRALPSEAPAVGADVMMSGINEVENLIKGLVSLSLEVPVAAIDPERSFSEYGLDSITGVDLIRRINQSLNLALRTTIMFDYPSVREFARYLLDQHGEQLSAALPLRDNMSVPPHAGERSAAASTPVAHDYPEETYTVVELSDEAAGPSAASALGPVNAGFIYAAQLNQPGEIEEISIAPLRIEAPGTGQVQIAVKAAALNFADLLCVKGMYPVMPAYPFVPGFEVSGTVEAVGPGVTDFKRGDDVIAILDRNMGGHAEKVNADALFVVAKPPEVSHEDAASFPIVFLTAHFALEKADLRKGEKILIQTAAGGTGLIAVQLARQVGAEIFATAGTEKKLAHLKSLGVEHLINYREEDFAERIRQLTGGYGVDVVINTLSGEAIQKGLDLLAPGGRYLEIALTGLKTSAPLNLSRLVQNQSFLSLNAQQFMLAMPEKTRQSMSYMAEVLRQGIVRPSVDRVFPFESIKAAYNYLQNRRNIGKVVLSFRDRSAHSTDDGKHPSAAVVASNPPPQSITTREIAVIAMSGRFPGARNLSEFWRNLSAGENSIRDVPAGRWDDKQHAHLLEDADYRTYCLRSGFLDDIALFDPLFFNLSGAEAEYMDPQQRLFLEESWKVFEEAGYSDKRVARTRCGVYVGANSGDYLYKLSGAGAPPEPYALTGNHSSILSARIAYLLNLKGPCLTIDTACSSSLVAVHLACQALLAGDCEIALAGGVFIATTPIFHLLCAKAGMLSATGQCHTFSNDADGFVPGEGVGVLLLKPLEKALADNDPVLAVIRGTGVNQDGKTNGITAPSSLSQTQLELEVYQRCGINPETITYVEAHGTGTKLGDPIEIEALTNAFSRHTEKKGFCAISSVKTNIGHTVYAAGIAGLIKVLLALKHRQLPPSLNFSAPNDEIAFAGTPFYVNTRLSDWQAHQAGAVRRAAVSSFGFSGTNCHIVLEESTHSEGRRNRRTAARTFSSHLIAVSARTDEALRQKLIELRSWLDNRHDVDIDELAASLSAGRTHFSRRFAAVVESSSDLLRRLTDYIEGGTAPGVVVEPTARDEAACVPLMEREALEQLMKEAIGEGGAADISGRRLNSLMTLAEQYVSGAELDWTIFYADGQRAYLPVPVYPFAREHYWLPLSERDEEREQAAAAAEPTEKGVKSLAEETESLLRSLISESLKIPASVIESRTTWEAYGLDSIMISRLNRVLESEFGPLSKTLFFEYRRLRDLASYFSENHREALEKRFARGRAETAPSERVTTKSVGPELLPLTQHESIDVAIIGMAGRYPMAEDLHEFWENLRAGRDCISEVPAKRWNHDLYFDTDRENPTACYCKWGGFLEDVDKFDPLFFNISPREAELMDPQERLFLEVAWHAIEDAGYTPTGLSANRMDVGAKVGVFVGVTWGSYQLFGAEEWARGRVVFPSGAHWTIANRVSYLFNFSGPSLPVDTACSSSLMAIHLARESLLSGACEMAIAGGVNLYLHPSKYVAISQQQFVSSDGKCRSFGEGGDGYVPGEGVGAVVLKRLDAAIADGDHIYAVIKGSAINHGGRTGGYTVPNPNAQAELITEALRSARVDPQTISYVEAHGTGTALGDPIEISGLTKAYRAFTASRQYCAIGSVKSNIGHLESGAGIAGVTKVLLQLKHRELVPSLYAERLNPNINFDETPFYVQRERGEWASQGTPRRACVSSFGAGGANAHLILEEYVEDKGSAGQSKTGASTPELILLSARDPERLRLCAQRLSDYLLRHQVCAAEAPDVQTKAEPDWKAQITLKNIAFTLQVGREAMPSRLAFIADSVSELLEKLEAYLKEDSNGAELTIGDLTAHRAAPPLGDGPEDLAYLRELLHNRRLTKLAALWAAGVEVDWKELRREESVKRIPLPGYPFTDERYWLPQGVEHKISARPAAASAESNSLLYLTADWEPAPLYGDTAMTGEDAPLLLLFAQDERYLDALREKWHGPADNIVLAKPGTEFLAQSASIYQIAIDEPDSYRALLRGLASRRAGGPTHVLHLWNVEAGLDDYGLSGAEQLVKLDSQLGRGVLSLLHLSQAVMALKARKGSVKLLYLHSTPAYGYAPANAAAGGFLRTLVNENPSISAGMVGLDEAHRTPEAVARVAIEELRASPATEHEVRYDSAGRWRRVGREVSRLGSSPQEPARFRENGLYLISGGAGELGLHVARHLAQTAHARLILLGRRRFGSESVRVIKEMRSLGGDAIYLPVDLTDGDATVQALARAVRRFGHLNGVIHAAGVIEDAFILKKEEDSFRRVLAPKISGTLNLDHATASEPLDFFVMFSSLAALLGNVGQSDYASANSFMDAYAAYRNSLRDEGKRFGATISIGWPLWEQGRMRPPEESLREFSAKTGMAAMPTGAGLEALHEVLELAVPSLFVAYGERARLKAFLTLATATDSHVSPAPEPAGSILERAEGFLKRLCSAEIKLPPERIDARATLDSYGINSVMIKKMNQKLEHSFGPLSKTLFFEFQTIHELAQYFVDQHGERLREMFLVSAGSISSEAAASVKINELATPAEKAEREVCAVPEEAAVSPDDERHSDDIAIIGLGGRYPGAADLNQFWRNLCAGKDCITEVPSSRWNHARYYDPDKSKPGKSYCKWGGFLEDVDKFDSLFFNISPREAELMDPQERLFLEVAWQTVEDAGYTRESLNRGHAAQLNEVGVFVGVTWGSYQLLGVEAWERGHSVFPNSAYWSIANRVSYVLNLHGPSLPIDTACSSSLTAIHLAAESIRRGECRMALAGGVNLYLHPSKYVQMSKLRFASSDGRCSSFGEGGDGYVPGEGVGAILLKPLAEAIRDRDHIYAVIRGSAINHGGKTNGFTVPNLKSQAELISEALRRAGINPRTLSYLEAHGTGTSLGDPIEVDALTKAFRPQTPDRQFCAIGSVKSNIGHLESAAGIAGVTKVLLQLKHESLVPSLHSSSVNPNINFPESPFYLQHSLSGWHRPVINLDGRETVVPRRAGISSFGAGGANAHLILEEYQERLEPEAADVGPQLIVLSARTQEQLRVMAMNLKNFVAEDLKALTGQPDAASGEATEREAGTARTRPLRDIAYTLQLGREEMASRLALVVNHRRELIEGLEDFLEGRNERHHLLNRTLSPEEMTAAAQTTIDCSALMEEGEWQELAKLWVSGHRVDWAAHYLERPAHRLSLPTYPFAGRRYWITVPEATASEQGRKETGAWAPLHPLIDGVRPSLKKALFEKNFDSHQPLLRDHIVSGASILPGAAYLEMARAAADQLRLGGELKISRFVWLRPLEVSDNALSALIELEEESASVIKVHVSSLALDVLTLHATGEINIAQEPPASHPADLDLDAIRRRACKPVEAEDFYAVFEAVGIKYGQGFRCVREVWAGESEVLGKLELSRQYIDAQEEYYMHPAILDGSFQLAQVLLTGSDNVEAQLLLPFTLGALTCHAVLPPAVYAYVQQVNTADARRLAWFNIHIVDEDGRLLVEVKDFCLRMSAPVEEAWRATPPRMDLYELDNGIELSEIGRSITPILRQLAEGNLTPFEADQLLAQISE